MRAEPRGQQALPAAGRRPVRSLDTSPSPATGESREHAIRAFKLPSIVIEVHFSFFFLSTGVCRLLWRDSRPQECPRPDHPPCTLVTLRPTSPLSEPWLLRLLITQPVSLEPNLRELLLPSPPPHPHPSALGLNLQSKLLPSFVLPKLRPSPTLKTNSRSPRLAGRLRGGCTRSWLP